MTPLVWDEVGERIYQTGVDRGVLYLHDGRVAVWNGLTSVEETASSELKSYHLDGVKYLEVLSPGDFLAKLKAITYPEEFDSVNGIVDVSPGLSYYDQPAKSFDLSYRTTIGNDLDSDAGYKIHILYNILANPSSVTFNTLKDTVEPVEFEWSLSGTPEKVSRQRPTAHISIDSRETPSDILKILEATLYGTETSAPGLPSILEISEIFGYRGALIIIDHGDGAWSAVDESDTFITILDGTTFQIVGADATYLDAVSYTISSTNVNN